MTHDHPARHAVIASIRCAHDPVGEPAWAHVSGWAQLSGSPRSVSCVVSCRNAARLLSRLLPEMSDLLTEAGFPWEMMCVDGASTDGTGELLSEWSEIPGFTWIRLARDYDEAVVIETGMQHARGDAVVLVGATVGRSIELLPEMIEKWEEGNEVVVVRHDEGRDNPRLVCWSIDGSDGMANALDDERSVMDEGQLMLLDRQVVDLLLQATRT